MEACTGCYTICCIIAYNMKRKINFCPCQDCIIKVKCGDACRQYRSFFKFAMGVDPSRMKEYKQEKVYEAYYKPEFEKPSLHIHVLNLNKPITKTRLGIDNPYVMLHVTYKEE